MSNCKNCLFIRYFLVSVIIIVLTALIFTENLKYLSFVTPTLLSYLIILLGVIVFIIKVLAHYKKKLSIFNKPNKVRNMTRKSSKSMSCKKVNCPHKPRLPLINFTCPKRFWRCIGKNTGFYFCLITLHTY